MDINPSQPEQNSTGKHKPTSNAAPNPSKKHRPKRSEAHKSAPAAKPADDPIAPAATPPMELIEEQLNEDMDGMIATAAYYLAERRNFAPGHELEDWLEAEQQIRR